MNVGANCVRPPIDVNGIKAICGKYGATFMEGVPVAPYTSFRIGGKCNIVKINKTELLAELLQYCRDNNVTRYILGNGSNVLISDDGLSGLVLLFGNDFGKIVVENEYISCQAGAKLSDICNAALENSLTGLEFAYGIPGTAGGALYMNAGAYGGEIKDVVRGCSYLNENCDKLKMKLPEMSLSYRHSVFCENDWVITHVLFRLEKGEPMAIKARMDEVMAARREKQPLEFPSGGSTFKRPEGYFAAKLIDDSGLRGYSVGGAQVSEKHCGFVINRDRATFSDVTELIKYVKDEVFNKTGIPLECEIRIIK